MRSVTNADYHADEQGVLHLKPEVAEELHLNFVEAIQSLSKERGWDIALFHGDNSSEWDPTPVITLPLKTGDSVSYSVHGGPICVRSRIDSLASNYPELSYHITKVRVVDGKLVEDASFPGVKINSTYVGIPGDYEPMMWAREIAFTLKGVHEHIDSNPRRRK